MIKHNLTFILIFLSLFSIAQENKINVSTSPSNNDRIQMFKKEQAEKNYYYEMKKLKYLPFRLVEFLKRDFDRIQ